MQNGLDADLAFDQNSRRLGRHSRLRTGSVGDVHAVHTRVFQQADRIERLIGVAAFRRQNLDRRYKFTAGDLSSPFRALLGRYNFYIDRRQLNHVRTLLSRLADRLPRTHGADRLGDELDVRRRRAAATADELGPD